MKKSSKGAWGRKPTTKSKRDMTRVAAGRTTSFQTTAASLKAIDKAVREFAPALRRLASR
jgi:hypothetical protein